MAQDTRTETDRVLAGWHKIGLRLRDREAAQLEAIVKRRGLKTRTEAIRQLIAEEHIRMRRA